MQKYSFFNPNQVEKAKLETFATGCGKK